MCVACTPADTRMAHSRTLKVFGKLKEKPAAVYVFKMLEVLDYWSNVVRCDLKVVNILTTKTRNAKLSNVGVSVNLAR